MQNQEERIKDDFKMGRDWDEARMCGTPSSPYLTLSASHFPGKMLGRP